MHDLMYTKEILAALAKRVVTLRPRERVAAVQVALSPLSHVKAATLKETFAALVASTPFSGVRLEVKARALKLACEDCGLLSTVTEPTFACPKCGSAALTLKDSKEFSVESFTIDSQPPRA